MVKQTVHYSFPIDMVQQMLLINMMSKSKHSSPNRADRAPDRVEGSPDSEVSPCLHNIAADSTVGKGLVLGGRSIARADLGRKGVLM